MRDTSERQLSGLTSFSLLRQLGTKLQAIFISHRCVTRHRFADVQDFEVLPILNYTSDIRDIPLLIPLILENAERWVTQHRLCWGYTVSRQNQEAQCLSGYYAPTTTTANPSSATVAPRIFTPIPRRINNEFTETQEERIEFEFVWRNNNRKSIRNIIPLCIW